MTTEELETEFRGIHSPTVLELARVLYEEMEHLEPGCCGGRGWNDLEPYQVDFYSMCVKEMLAEKSLIHRAMLENDMVVCRFEPPRGYVPRLFIKAEPSR